MNIHLLHQQAADATSELVNLMFPTHNKEEILGVFNEFLPDLSIPIEDFPDVSFTHKMRDQVAGSVYSLAATNSIESQSQAEKIVEQIRSHRDQFIFTPGELPTFIRQAGGIFLGEKELEFMRAKAEVPPVPKQFNVQFFNSKHPLRDGTIAGHCIVGFDRFSSQWRCFERTVVPGSLNLSGPEQDKLLLNVDGSSIEVEGVQISSPTDNRPIRSILDTLIAFLASVSLSTGRLFEEQHDIPFHNVLARTADPRAEQDCTICLGLADWMGVHLHQFVRRTAAIPDLGLLAEWKLKN